jgi:hypothetical protein
MGLNVKNKNGSDCCKRDAKIITNVTNSINYIKYTISGSCPAEKVSKLAEEIYELCQKKNIWRVLLDTSGVRELNINMVNQFYYGESIAKVLNGSVRLAVHGEGEIYTDFTETVAVNRGADVKVSNDYNNLKSWLLDN